MEAAQGTARFSDATASFSTRMFQGLFLGIPLISRKFTAYKKNTHGLGQNLAEKLAISVMIGSEDQHERRAIFGNITYATAESIPITLAGTRISYIYIYIYVYVYIYI